MNRMGIWGAWGLCLGLSVGCGGGDRPADETRAADDIDIAETTTITETGCLTSAGDRFVLTALEGGGGAQTELYQLIGNEADLRPHVGREVNVSGMAEPAQVATVRETSPAAATGTAGGGAGADAGAGAQAEVRTESETRLETRRMQVTSVTPTGDECVSGAAR